MENEAAPSRPSVPAAPKSPRSDWLAPVFGVLAAVALLLALGPVFSTFRLFTQSSDSMAPTLSIRDTAFAIRYRSPFLPDSLFGSTPKRGDVVVFKLPRDPSIFYLKRLIGLPGDRVQMRGGRLFLNGAEVERAADGFLRGRRGGDPLASGPIYRERLPDGVSWRIVKTDRGAMWLDDTKEFEVPPGHYFVLGDNRDNSVDSRVAADEDGVGYVPAENVVWRAKYVLFSLTPTDGPGERGASPVGPAVRRIE